jgi:hypothetical protein
VTAVHHGHYHHHHHRHRPRRPLFYLATALTIVVVAYVLVPPLTWLVDSLAGYMPRNTPVPRAGWLRSPAPGLGDVTWDVLVDVGLLLVVAIVWITVVPRATGRRRPPP